MSVWTTAHLVATGTFEDPKNARVIYLAAGGLVLLAVLLAIGTWLWWRSAKVEHTALAPLEVMGSRRWTKAEFTEQQRMLQSVRAAELAALADAGEGGPADDVPVAAVDLDDVLTREDSPGFADLAEPAADAPTSTESDDAAEVEVAEMPVAAVASLAVKESRDESVASTDVAEVAAPAEPVAAEPAVAETVVEPAVEPAVEPIEVGVTPAVVSGVSGADETAPVEAPAAAQPKPIVVIDTAPATASLLSVEPVETAVDDQSDNTPQHIDPLLRTWAE